MLKKEVNVKKVGKYFFTSLFFLSENYVNIIFAKTYPSVLLVCTVVEKKGLSIYAIF